MRRIALFLSILATFLVTLTSCGNPLPNNERVDGVIIAPEGSMFAESPELKEFQQPYKAPTEDTVPAPVDDRPVEGDLVTQEVATWGEVIRSDDAPLTLQALDSQPGDLTSTTRVILELCAEEDVNMPDTAMYDTILQVIELPTDGVINASFDSPEFDSLDNDLLSPPHTIVIDNTPTMVVESQDGYPSAYDIPGQLLQILPAGECTSVHVEVYADNLEKLVVGFAYTTIPFGEWRPNGGFTRLQPNGEATTFQHQWDVN